ncbi:MAG: hypothetical protein NUV50_06150 [Rhodospirillales bacterium]|nr:hypothetical protein [Rhodospirillales bacterium]
MSSQTNQRLLDVNAMVMGNGVGLAALESMFNLVQTQSLLSASMVRDHNLSGSLALEALAIAIGEVLDPGVYSACRSCRRTKPIPVDIPPVKASVGAVNEGTRRGAGPSGEALNDITGERVSSSATEVHTSDSDIQVEQLLEKIFDLLDGHMKDMTNHMNIMSENSRNRLMVT